MDTTDRPEQARKLAIEIDADLAKRTAPKNILEQMRRSALGALQTELAELSELLGTTKHRLVFIGQVGVGKTTAICHLVGLTADRQKKKTNKAGRETTGSVTEDLMATGSGFTTLCEVVVMPGETNRFKIEPYPAEEVKRTISDFCMTIWKRVYPDTDSGQEQGSGTDQVNFPPELVRAVRNMVKLREGEKREDDAAIRLAREFSADGFAQFEDRVLQLAKLDGRTQTEFVCPADDKDPRAWIKRTFDDLNLAKLDTVSIPKRITLKVDAR